MNLIIYFNQSSFDLRSHMAKKKEEEEKKIKKMMKYKNITTVENAR